VSEPLDDGPEFDFHGMAVGLFIGAGPETPGPAEYVPYRGPGHYELQQALRDGRIGRCSYAPGDRRVSVDVLGNAPGEPQALLLGNFHIA
jgi:hypothetical protein